MANFVAQEQGIVDDDFLNGFLKDQLTMSRLLSINSRHSSLRLTREEMMTRALAFAHSSPTGRQIVGALALFQWPHLSYWQKTIDWMLDHRQDYYRERWRKIAPARRAFRQRLSKLLISERRKISLTRADRETLQRELIIVPYWDSECTPESLVFPRSEKAAMVYCLAVLAHAHVGDDGKYTLRSRLSQCAREDCGAFFFQDVPKGNKTGRRKKYCSRECMRVVNNRRPSAERVAEWRKRKAK